MTVFCDNYGCMFIDECGFCDCDKLSIVGGVCEGSMHGGRNASDGDIDERLKAEKAKLQDENARLRSCLSDDAENARMIMGENAKLRELVRDIWGSGHLDKSCGDCEIRDECHTEVEEAYKKGSGRWNIGCLFERRIKDRMRDLGFEV